MVFRPHKKGLIYDTGILTVLSPLLPNKLLVMLLFLSLSIRFVDDTLALHINGSALASARIECCDCCHYTKSGDKIGTGVSQFNLLIVRQIEYGQSR